ncbi:MAG: hypothetical protein A3F16_06540 [Deltaproteobacteria bacterium RIFCSPHIGHO2_12_FULL_43_9]|nr:MAG: hypothetical protein A3F16_06540 [Deltaproteobacteria bacterium RIFCSPHIGHO2_12_FULL_43_9]
MSMSVTAKIEPIKEVDPIKLKAEDIYLELKKNGYSQKELLNFISCLIEKITEEKKRNQSRTLVSV